MPDCVARHCFSFI